MATTPIQYHLGAPTSILLDANTTSELDFGSSMGGVTVDVKPTMVKAQNDQYIGPVAAWMAELECTISMSLPELHADKFLAAMSRPTTGVTTVASGTLSTQSACTLATFGTAGSTSYSYEIVAFSSNGDGEPSTAATITTGPATLSSAAGITLTLPALTSGAIGMKIIRTAGGVAQGLIATLYGAFPSTIQDTGLVATTYSAAVTQPTFPGTATIYMGNGIAIPTHQLDLIIPRPILGQTLNRRFTAWSVYSSGDFSLPFERDKQSEYKVELSALMQITQPAGQEFFRLVNELQSGETG